MHAKSIFTNPSIIGVCESHQPPGALVLLSQREQSDSSSVHLQQSESRRFPLPQLRNRGRVRFLPLPHIRVTEITGVLTEIYLLSTTCLPASSSLLQRDRDRGIAPAHKLLIEILFFQLFTFPLLAWSEVRPILSSLLSSHSLAFC